MKMTYSNIYKGYTPASGKEYVFFKIQNGSFENLLNLIADDDGLELAVCRKVEGHILIRSTAAITIQPYMVRMFGATDGSYSNCEGDVTTYVNAESEIRSNISLEVGENIELLNLGKPRLVADNGTSLTYILDFSFTPPARWKKRGWKSTEMLTHESYDESNSVGLFCAIAGSFNGSQTITALSMFTLHLDIKRYL